MVIMNQVMLNGQHGRNNLLIAGRNASLSQRLRDVVTVVGFLDATLLVGMTRRKITEMLHVKNVLLSRVISIGIPMPLGEQSDWS